MVVLVLLKGTLPAVTVPVVVLTENGKELRRFTGVKSYNQIIDWLNYGN